MPSPISPGRLARASAQRPWLVVAVWVLLLVAAGAIVSRGLAGVLTGEQTMTSRPESVRAAEQIEASGIPGREHVSFMEVVIVRSAQRTAAEPAFQQFGATLLADIRARTSAISSGTGFADAANPAAPFYVSQDRHTALLQVTLAGDAAAAEDHVGELIDLVRARDGQDGFEVLTYGYASTVHTFNEISERDLQQAERQGLPVALVILILVFGAVVAAFVPIALAAIAIVVALAAVTIIGQQWHFSFFVTNMVVMIGLAVGIDYCLFIIERFREERRRGLDKIDAIAVAGDTASRAVLFSGVTVVIALSGMFIVPANILRSLGAGAVIVTIAALSVTLTLLPAVLSLFGDRVSLLAVPFFSRRGNVEDGSGFWAAAARAVMRRPWLSLLASAGVLVALALPYASIEIGLSGAGALPPATMAHRANEILAAQFSQGIAQPTEIVVTAPDVRAASVQRAIATTVARLTQDPRFSPPSVVVNPRGDLALISVAIDGEPASLEAVDAIRALRSEILPPAFAGSGARAEVSGISAFNTDFFDLVGDNTPLVFAFVLTFSFLLLLMVFRSLIVPLKAIVMNLLSVGAAYGVLVLVFQQGVGIELLGFRRSPIIEAWLPLFLFTILFGLSMDYHVFLLSRIRERFDRTHDNAEAVAFGLRATANIITGAALIMVAVFGSFALGEMVEFQQLGFGLAVAVFLDATIVRMVLVPSAMELLGERNWYLPRWLDWLPDLRVEGRQGRQRPLTAPDARV